MVGQRQVSDSAQPRSIGELLDAMFRQYRTHFKFWFLAAACVLIPFMVLDSIFNYNSASELKTFLTTVINNSSQSMSALQAFQTAQQNLPVTWALGLIQIFIVMPLLYGTLLHFITELQLYHRTPGIDESFSKSVRRLFAVFITSLVFWVLVFVALMVVVMVIALIAGAISLAKNSILIGVAAAILSIAFLIAIFWFMVRMAFISSAVLQDGKIFFSAIARSWVLTRGNFWRTFGFFILVYLIVNVLQGGLGIVITVFVKNGVTSVVLTNLVSLFATPLLLLGRANIYTDLRLRTDSLDLQRWLSAADEGNGSTTQE